MVGIKRKRQTYEVDMCHGPILKKMLCFAIPLICSGLLQLLFNAADVIVVGRFAGEESLAAVGATTALVNLFVNFFIGLSVGTNVLVSRYYGAGQKRHLSETVHTAVLMSLLGGVLLAAIGIAGTPFILKLMQTPKEVFDLAVIYARMYFVGVPAMLVYNFGAAILRSVGDTKHPLYFLILSGLVNVMLNLFLVIVLNWGVFGVGLATAISQVISAVLVLRRLTLEEGGIRVELRCLHIYRDKFIQILQTGLPAGTQSILFNLSNLVVQSSVNSFGATVVAGNSAAANVEGFVYISMNAFYQTNISFTSQNVGAGKFNRLNRILFAAQGCVIVMGLTMGVASYLAGPVLLSLYTDSQAAIEAGMVRLRYISLPYVLGGIMEVIVGSLRGMGYAMFPMVVSLVGCCMLRVVWLLTVFKMEQFHVLDTVYLIYPISWIITIIAHIITYFYVKKKKFEEQ